VVSEATQLSVGGEKSISGNLIDLDVNGSLLPSVSYNPFNFREGSITGTPGEGLVTTQIYTSEIEQIRQDDISFEDAYSTPLNIRGGFEYIVGPKTTVFANAGYVYAEGERTSAVVQAELQRITQVEGFEPLIVLDPDTGTAVDTGQVISTGASTNIGFIPNVDVATFDFEFSDVERIDLEVGARQYFNPILAKSTNASITPFVGISGGAARYNDQSVSVDQRHSQWVPTGTVTAGIEWQATPRTALAFETGLRYEGGREDVNELRGDDNISVPFTIRGSYNF